MSVYVVPVGCAIRFAALGVKPGLVERWTLYWVTPTLSVAAPQFSVAWPVPGVAVRDPGAVGGEVSGGTAGGVTPWSRSNRICPAVRARL